MKNTNQNENFYKLSGIIQDNEKERLFRQAVLNTIDDYKPEVYSIGTSRTPLKNSVNIDKTENKS